jgi:hypothetical protein
MLNDSDVATIRSSGRDPQQVQGQFDRLVRGPRPRHLVRPCTIGHGLVAIHHAEQSGYVQHHDRAASAGRVSAFVPASGAATRMFAGLEQHPELLDHATQLALWPSLGLPRGTPLAEVARAIVTRWSDTPKGLVPFHHYATGPRTAFEEHLTEASRLVKDRDGIVRVHFTVGVEHQPAFERALRTIGPIVEARAGVKLQVAFSNQDPATDAVCLDGGAAARDGSGKLAFRPGGHGALLTNLARTGGDIVLIKNIDNIVPDGLRPNVLHWRASLSGMLVLIQDRVYDLLHRLDTRGESALSEAVAFCVHWFGIRPALDREAVIDALDRPLRVCGMVANDGQPGGGPFVVEDAHGPQIVESAEVDRNDAQQAATWAQSTHFNPVDLAVGLRDFRGEPFDLAKFSDPDAAIVTRKQQGGRELVVYEHPGLWNGGMARWNSIFAEIDRAVFQPVKNVADLLGPGHR